MFGVLMVPLFPSLYLQKNEADSIADFLFALGLDRRIDKGDLSSMVRRGAFQGVQCA